MCGVRMNKKIKIAEKLFLACDFDEAFLRCKELAEEGNARAMYLLGILYGFGYGHVERNRDACLHWLERSTAEGEYLAWVAMASIIPPETTGVSTVFNGLAEMLIPLAQAGDIFAQYEVGMLYINGWGIEPDIEKGAEWIKKSADTGYFIAMDDLATLYKERALGSGREKDAWRYYLKAAGLGYRDAEYHLGECYYEGCGIERDLEKAVICYKKALSNGSMQAADALGTMCILGEGNVGDKHKAFSYFKKASQGGYIRSLGKLGDCYYYGRGIAQDFVKARTCYEEAWEHGDYFVAVHIGTIYLVGLGVAKDEKTALAWFTKSAEAGDPDGVYFLAECYWFGIGTLENKEKAITMYVNAAEVGQVSAMTRLGEMAQASKRYEEAVHWFESAASLGYPPAENLLAICYYKGNGVPKNEKIAREWLNRAEVQGDKEATRLKQQLWGITSKSNIQ